MVFAQKDNIMTLTLNRAINGGIGLGNLHERTGSSKLTNVTRDFLIWLSSQDGIFFGDQKLALNQEKIHHRNQKELIAFGDAKPPPTAGFVSTEFDLIAHLQV